MPGDSRVEAKENEKVQKYQDLARELRKLWQVKVKVVHVVVGALGYNPEGVGETSQGDRGHMLEYNYYRRRHS